MLGSVLGQKTRSSSIINLLNLLQPVPALPKVIRFHLMCHPRTANAVVTPAPTGKAAMMFFFGGPTLLEIATTSLHLEKVALVEGIFTKLFETRLEFTMHADSCIPCYFFKTYSHVLDPLFARWILNLMTGMERPAQAHSHVYMPRWIETCSACFGEDFKISILNGDFQMGSNHMKLPTTVATMQP